MAVIFGVRANWVKEAPLSLLFHWMKGGHVMKRVLVVDDTKNIRVLLTTCLEVEGYEADTASDGKAALEKLQANAYDLAFLDIKLPELSGTEVLRKLRASDIYIPIVIMTAFATVKNAIECTKLGAVQYLQKPFTAEKVRMVMKELEEGTEHVSHQKNMDMASHLMEQEEWIAAYEVLKKCLAYDPENADTYYLMGICHDKQGQNAKAEKFLTAAKYFSE
jgi:DNA-binding response OmpR family regulator